jgi:CRISPR-associated protein Csy3
MAKKDSKIASVLAFERKLCNSDALMYSGNWSERGHSEKWTPLEKREKAVRGTISNRLKSKTANDPVKLDAEIEKPNLQTVDIATLPFEHDTLRISFTLKVLGDLSNPSVCNSPSYQEVLTEKIQGYAAIHTFDELSWRYAENLANGRFLWRNRVGAEAIEVIVRHKEGDSEGRSWKFDARSFSIRTFSKDPSLAELAAAIKEGLSGDSYTFLSVDAFVKLGAGQEVFPSQELVLDPDNSKKMGKKVNSFMQSKELRLSIHKK